MTVLTGTKSFNQLKYLILPLLLATYPPLYLYGNNAEILLLPSLGRALLLYPSLAILIFCISLIVLKGHSIKAANAGFTFLIFFHVYGIIYGFLIEEDLFYINHYILLPFFLLLAIYVSWFATKINSVSFCNTATLILITLVVLNVLKIVPAEVEKQQTQREQQKETTPITTESTSSNHPDVYYIIFDELAGVESMKNYWEYQGVDDFVSFARSKGFFVAESSKSSSAMTLHQLSERLNYREYPVGKGHVNTYYVEIKNNEVMRRFKSMGYTTIVFEETAHFLEALPPIDADYTYEYEASGSVDLGILFDEFGTLVADNTMLRVFSNTYRSMDPTIDQHKAWIHFTTEKLGDLNEIRSPKFIYVHLILPHMPFVFDEYGNSVDQNFHYNWNYYLGNYKYAIKLAERMINNILSNADSNTPPVIIIQSDHGVRNIQVWQPGSVLLKDFPQEYSTDIINMMYLPGFDTSQLSQDVDPINTFPIIFNHYFDMDIPLQK